MAVSYSSFHVEQLFKLIYLPAGASYNDKSLIFIMLYILTCIRTVVRTACTFSLQHLLAMQKWSRRSKDSPALHP